MTSLLTSPPETPYQTAARETILGMQAIRNANLGMLRDLLERTFGTDNHQFVMDQFLDKSVSIVSNYEGMREWMHSMLTLNGDEAGLSELHAIDAMRPDYQKNEDGTVTIIVPETESE